MQKGGIKSYAKTGTWALMNQLSATLDASIRLPSATCIITSDIPLATITQKALKDTRNKAISRE